MPVVLLLGLSGSSWGRVLLGPPCAPNVRTLKKHLECLEIGLISGPSWPMLGLSGRNREGHVELVAEPFLEAPWGQLEIIFCHLGTSWGFLAVPGGSSWEPLICSQLFSFACVLVLREAFSPRTASTPNTMVGCALLLLPFQRQVEEEPVLFV